MRAIKDIARNIIPGQTWVESAPEKNKTPDRARLSQLDTSHHPLVKTAVNAAYKWLERKKTHSNASLVLVASPVQNNGAVDIDRTGYGCGKTHIARSILWAQYIAHEDGTPVAPCGRFFMAADLIELLAPGEKGNRPPELVPPPRIRNGHIEGGAHALIIDDVGTENVIQYVSKEAQAREIQARYFEIINYCYGRPPYHEDGISLVITANMTLDELATHLGGRCWSRLLEMAPAGFMIDMTGVPDYRRQVSGR